MNIADPNAIARFRATTANSMQLSLVRKRCAAPCNKVVTAKQLQNYGMCAHCYNAKKAKLQ